MAGSVVVILILLLVSAVFLQSETGLQFQYRGQGRWTGPWDNPNIFGMLMGLGCVLALGQFLSLISSKEKRHLTPALSPDEAEREASAAGDDRRASNVEQRPLAG